MIKQSSVTIRNVITCVELVQSGLRSTAAELVPSRAAAAVTNIQSRASYSSFCEAGALGRSSLPMNTLAKLLLALLLFAMWRRQHKDAREATSNFTR